MGLQVKSGVQLPAPPVAGAPALAVEPPLVLAPPLVAPLVPDELPALPDGRPPCALPVPAVLLVPPLDELVFESSLDEQPVSATATPAALSKPNKKPRSVMLRAYPVADFARWLFPLATVFMRGECQARLHVLRRFAALSAQS